jgi:hypothetical protein
MRGARDWANPTYINAYGNLSDANCEQAFHNFLVTPVIGTDYDKFIHCLDLSYEGWDLPTGVGGGGCNGWKASLPVIADDYDGDGKSDPVVFRPSTNNWYSRRSQNNSQQQVAWGLSGDKPIFGADYDGDRVADPAVMRTSSGSAAFYIRPSTGACP